MKFTLAWLKEHLDTKATVETIADTLTRIGLEVEKAVRSGQEPRPVPGGGSGDMREAP